MPLHPAIQSFLDFLPEENLDHLTGPQQRHLIRLISDASFLRFGETPAEVHSVRTVTVSGLRLRIYRPNDDDALPVHLLLHGGAWWLGSIDELIVDATCRERALGVQCVVVSVDYRLAPEHPFPAALDDARVALEWVAGHAGDRGVDAANLSVGGASAGANLSAALALRARDDGGPAITFQLLEVPALDLTCAHCRATQAPATYDLDPEELSRFVAQYLPDPALARHPHASPLLAEDLSGLPPAHIMTAEFDPLRDEGERYAERLRQAGVPATNTRHGGAIHGSIGLTRTFPGARAWRAEVLDTLNAAHHRRPSTGSASTLR